MIREKGRYLSLRIESPQPVSARDAKHLLYSAVIEFLGEAGASRSRLRWKEFDEKNQAGIARCSLSALEETIAAIALKRFWQGRDVAIRLEKMSGAIGKLAPATSGKAAKTK